MKHIIVLSLMMLTACGSGGSGGQNSQAGAVGQSYRHALLIVDPMSQNLSPYVAPAGYDVSTKVADSLYSATTVDGTHLDGAGAHIAAWLAEKDYDVIIICLGQYEWMHNYSADMSVHGGYAEGESHSFFNAVGATGPRLPVVYAWLPTSAVWPINNAASLNLTALDVRSFTWDQIGVAVNQAVGQM